MAGNPERLLPIAPRSTGFVNILSVVVEKRLHDELLRLFAENNFYFSLSGDLTNSLQRQHDNLFLHIGIGKRRCRR